ncbi:AKR_collapsed_G0027830.mRNA.1.CDS.1 [Saccharomyces cerevisiae]|nr:AKR_collapsed_G0027830.mRNA.1.CDS.1 [Saccharomyces cerevisiae]
MSGTRCLLGVGLPVDVTATETLTHDEQGPGVEPGPCSRGSSIDGLLPSLLGSHDDVDDDSAAFHNRRHRSSVSTISAILHQGKSVREDITESLSVPAEQEKLSFLAKASSIFFRRNSMPRDKHTHSVCPASRPDSERFIVTSAAAQSLRRQQQLEDAQMVLSQRDRVCGI